MAASLTYCRYCPPAKRENVRKTKAERRSYHKLLRRIGKHIARQELTLDISR